MFLTTYEEFCSKYELLTQDLALLRRSIPNWAMFDQGIEALSKSVASMESRKQEGNKSMSLNDLLIKVFCPSKRSHFVLLTLDPAYPASLQIPASAPGFAEMHPN